MAIKREYNILPQGDKDDFHHHVKDGRRGGSSQYICLFTVMSVVIFAILAGVAILTATMFYSDQLSTTFGHFWYSYDSASPNGTNNSNTSGNSSLTMGSWFSVGRSRNETTSAPHYNSTDYLDPTNYTSNSTHHYHHHNQHGLNHKNYSSFDNSSIDESDLSYSLGNSTTNKTSDSGESESTMDTGGQDIINTNELKEKFAEAMREFEKHMENLTGIRKAEFVVPIFMLISFLVLFSLVSICCCIMMRRRDNRRRKLFGKLITDLQTGDSKTVLLNHSDLDD